MPHSTADLAMRAPSLNRSHNTKSHADTYAADPSHGAPEKFPDFDGGLAPSNGHGAGSRWQNGNGYTNGGTSPTERWHARRDSRVKWAPSEAPQTHHGHGRQPSITHAIRHMRSGSMSQNAHEIADALRAPVSYRLIVCAPLAHGDVQIADMCSRVCV
jgi:solute carrier family 35 protein E1